MATQAEPRGELAALYRNRFGEQGLDRRNKVWRVLTRDWFDAMIPPGGSVLELACGYGEFINNVRAETRAAIDLNPDAARHLAPGIYFHRCSATDRLPTPTGPVDIVFTSNFLEHLRSRDELAAVLANAFAALKPGGRFIVMGPNIRFAYREYWDFIDHYLPLSDRSLAEALRAAGFAIERSIPRFLPFSMQGRLPTWDWLIRLYLRAPALWRLFGKQFLIVARKH